MPTNRIASSLLTILVMALLAGCGGGSTATQSAGVSSSSLTTTSSVTPSASASSTSTSASTTSSLASTSTSRSTRSSHTQSVKPSTTGGTAAGGSAARTPSSKTPPGKFAVASAAFPHGGQIPARYTCDGNDVSPPLQWGKLPAGTSQLFVLALSLSAGASGAIRWAVGGVDPNSGGIPAGQLPLGAVAGRSSDGHIGWSGICGARGRPQAIIVLVYALRHPLHLSPGFDPRTVQGQLAGNTVGSGVIYGAYRRP
jgi:phosphatidylethanolamine-binding protein (PEBP) family uncharacterized protein